ncbi:hypothetical protein J1N35_005596 [Gossypium stocksii]|uniref:RNase H type-1 domain-containing protein n=1 Tax=Gossypium stocksii TaxID=47602 RepID=A0A9D4AJE8_9ROSI|nr:hypothetical protein J1N35_005596 [Gossypium stocksii]
MTTMLPNLFKTINNTLKFHLISTAQLDISCKPQAPRARARKTPRPGEVQLGRDLGIIMAVVEGDARTMVRKLQLNLDDGSEILAYIKDAKRLSNGFRRCLFRHAIRSANGVAHSLAKEGTRRNEPTYLLEDVPPHLFVVMELDQRWRDLLD